MVKMTFFGMVLLVAMVSSQMQDQPEQCRLYQVSPDNSSPTLEVPGNNNSVTYISLDLLLDNATASIIISDGDLSSSDGNFSTVWFSSCHIKVINATLQGNCFSQGDTPLRFSNIGDMNTIVLIRRGSSFIVHIYGDDSEMKVLKLQAPNPDKNITVQVNSDAMINTAFNCPLGCFQFANAFMEQNNSAWDAQQNISFIFTYPQNDVEYCENNRANASYPVDSEANMIKGRSIDFKNQDQQSQGHGQHSTADPEPESEPSSAEPEPKPESSAEPKPESSAEPEPESEPSAAEPDFYKF